LLPSVDSSCPRRAPYHRSCSSVCSISHLFSFFFPFSPPPRALHSFPTRRSSDLHGRSAGGRRPDCLAAQAGVAHRHGGRRPARRDRKSTRLNSSQVSISYAVFCLKKKKEECGNQKLDHTRKPPASHDGASRRSAS